MLKSKTKIFAFITLLVVPVYTQADRFGINDPIDEWSPASTWFYIYFIVGLWLCLGKTSPLVEVTNEHPVISMVLFMAVFPVIFTILFGWS